MSEASSVSAARDERHLPLLRLAGPLLYRKNIFRITGLPVDATPQAVRRLREEVKVAEALGAPLRRPDSPLPLAPPPDYEAVKEALQQFQDPELRFLHELFWLWKTEPDSQPEGSSSTTLAQAHNVAVTAHCEALDLEHAALSRALTDQERAKRDEAWTVSVRSWAHLTDQRELWDRLRAQVRRRKDPRLTTGAVRRMEHTLPLALLKPNAELALGAAQHGDAHEALRQTSLVRAWPFAADARDEVLRSAVEPLLKRVTDARETATKELAAGREHGLSLAERLLQQTGPLLGSLNRVLTPDHPTALAAHDEIAIAANICAVAYDSATDDALAACAILRKARPLATQPTTRELLDQNLRGLSQKHLLTRFKKVRELCDKGAVNRASVALQAWARQTKSQEVRDEINEFVSDPRNLITKKYGRPTLGGNTILSGRRAYDPATRTFAATLYFGLRPYPIVPITAFIVNGTQAGSLIYGKIPLGNFERWWRLLFYLVPCLVFAALSFGLVIGGLAGLAIAGGMALRVRWLGKWIARD